MEYLCPLCNSLYFIEKKCSICNTVMEDCGRIQDYYDDYSPYLSYSITNVMDEEPFGICQHIYTCPNCGNDYVLNVKRLIK